MDKLKELHDNLLLEKSEEDVHDESSCPFCNPDILIDKDSHERGEMKTFTEDELAAAVQAAIAPIQAELDALKDEKAEVEVDARIAEIQTESAELVSQAQADKDVAVLSATEATQKYEDLVSYLEAEQAAVAEAAAAEARKTERLDQIKEIASFKDEYIAENLDRWAALSDEAFDLFKDSLAQVSTKDESAAGEGAKIPETAMEGLRSSDGASPSRGIISRIKDASNAGVKISTLK